MASFLGSPLDSFTTTAVAILSSIVLVQLYLNMSHRGPRRGARRRGPATRAEPFNSPGLPSSPKQSEDLSYFALPFHEPSAQDVRLVKAMLQVVKKLPTELVDQILDQAEYWLHSESSIDFGDDQLYINGARADEEDRLILRAPPVGFPTGLKTTENERYRTQRVEPWRLQKEHPKEYFHDLISDGPPPTLEHPVRKIVFKIRSRDQGWGGRPEDRDTFNGSWTWFEAGLERFDSVQKCDPEGEARCELDHPRTSSATSATSTTDSLAVEVNSLAVEDAPGPNPNPLPLCSLRSVYPSTDGNAEGRRWYRSRLESDAEQKIQGNKTAHRDFVDYTIEWSWTDDISAESPAGEELARQGRGAASGSGDFVRNLKLGDVVTIWGHARFPGWLNKVEKAGIRVYWAI